MKPYRVLLSEQAHEYLRALDEKSRRIVKNNLEKLETPHPGRGAGDKERLVIDGERAYRLHIGRTHTAFYVIDDERGEARVFEICTIEQAHKRYGY